MRLLAIDPGSHHLGVALFVDRHLISSFTLSANPKHLELSRRTYLLLQLANFVTDFKPGVVVIEDPVCQGIASKILNRLIGNIEALMIIGSEKIPDLIFMNPMTVKKAMGAVDKPQVAKAARNPLERPEEKLILTEALTNERFDETDAIAVGCAYLLKDRYA